MVQGFPNLLRNTELSDLNEIEMVAPTGFGSQASLLEITFEGLALAA
jgi:hypothetical protein